MAQNNEDLSQTIKQAQMKDQTQWYQPLVQERDNRRTKSVQKLLSSSSVPLPFWGTFIHPQKKVIVVLSILPSLK